MPEVEKSSILKLNCPIGKLKFFVNSLILFAAQLLTIALYFAFYYAFVKNPTTFLILLVMFGIIFGLPLIYLNFVNYAKRLWDITADKKTAILATTVIFVASFSAIFLPTTFLFWLGIYFAMIFTNGKMVK